VKVLGDKCMALLNALGSFKPTPALGLDEFRKELVTRAEVIITLGTTDWKIMLKKADTELISLFTKVLEDHNQIFALVIKNIVLITSETIRTQIISVIQNLTKIIPVFVQVSTNVMSVTSGREAVSANFEKIFTALKQVWTNTIQTLKTFKGGSPPDSLTGIDTSADPTVVLNGLISFLNSEKASSTTVDELCKGFTVPKDYSEAVALWPQVIRALVTEIKAPEMRAGELMFQSARAVLYYRKVVLEPNSRNVKNWAKAAELLNKFSQEIVNLLVAKFSDQDITQKLATLVGIVKEIQQAL